MRRTFLAGVAAAAVMLAGQAYAQSVSVELAPEQRTKIKQYVIKEKVPSVKVKERVRVGGTLPPDVELRAVPSDWGPSVSRYKYIYSDDRVHFVDPDSRRVIYDID
jgi:hypothetical protein